MSNLDSTSNKSSEKYWSSKFVLINITLLIIAFAAAFVQYVSYPTLMTGPLASSGSNGPYGYGESNAVVRISFLTYQIDATGRTATGGQFLRGVPAFDFFQAFIYALLIINIIHFWNTRKR